MRGNVFDGLDDGTDLLGASAHLFDLGGGETDLGADGFHAVDGFLDGLGTIAGVGGGLGGSRVTACALAATCSMAALMREVICEAWEMALACS
ncbi:MAG: hypothetical protein IPJ46_10885 [Anaerolineales bacterium]|nr:hypothetical protein [Anaerolineales bacterium]